MHPFDILYTIHNINKNHFTICSTEYQEGGQMDGVPFSAFEVEEFNFIINIIKTVV